MRLEWPGLFDENQKLQRQEDEQSRDDGREYPDSGHDLDPFSQPTVFERA